VRGAGERGTGDGGDPDHKLVVQGEISGRPLRFFDGSLALGLLSAKQKRLLKQEQQSFSLKNDFVLSFNNECRLSLKLAAMFFHEFKPFPEQIDHAESM
jgi:hypothetical protein